MQQLLSNTRALTMGPYKHEADCKYMCTGTKIWGYQLIIQIL